MVSPNPLPSEETMSYNVLQTSALTPRQESGHDRLTCAIFARQRTDQYSRDPSSSFLLSSLELSDTQFYEP